MKKITAIALVLVITFALSLSGQGAPVQYNPVNSYTQVSGSSSAVVTISGVAGQRVRLYSIGINCTTTGSSTIPVVLIQDAGNTMWASPPTTKSSTSVMGFYHWSPGFAFSTGGTVVITGNYGGGCAGGTAMTVQADQF